jgi:hypothetical protein
MAQLTTAVITGVALLLGAKLLQKMSERQSKPVKATADAARRARQQRTEKISGTLVWDEQAGVYRPR